MNVIYHCYGGTHSSVIAAAIHLNWLLPDEVPNGKDLMDIPYFDTRSSNEQGCITYMGTDEINNKVFITGRGDYGLAMVNFLDELSYIFNIRGNTYRLINLMPYVNIKMRIGGILSRKVGLIGTGRPMVLNGSLKAFRNISKVVQEVKSNLEQRL